MKLVEAYVSSFGGMKDFSYKFDSDLNVINKENGFGKTTFSIFIKSMFYGLKDSKKNIEDNERIKYYPWNSTEKFGGYLIFEKTNKLYKIERFFGKKQSEDYAVLKDLDTGKEFSEVQNLGEKIFEIDEDGFLSTVFFAQKDFKVQSNVSLTAKYNDINDFNNDFDFNSCIKKLKENLKNYKYSGERGIIPQLKRDIFDTEKEISKAESAQNSSEILKLELQNYKTKINDTEKSIIELEKDYELAVKRETYNVKKKQFSEYSLQLKECKEKKSNAEIVLNGEKISEFDLQTLSDCINELQKINARKVVLESDFANLSCEDNKNKKNKSLKTVILCLSIFVACFGAVCLFFNLFLGFSFISLGIIGVIYGLITRKNNVYKDLAEKKRNDLQELIQTEKDANAKIEKYLTRFNLISKDFSNALVELINAKKTFDDCALKLEELSSKIKQLDFSDNDSSDYPIASLEDIKNRLTNERQLLQTYKEELLKINGRIKELEQESGVILDLCGKLSDLKAQLESAEEERKTLTLTIDFLLLAEENLKSKYKQPLQTEFNKYLSYLANDSASAQIDIDFNVRILENGFEKDTDYYSKGLKDLFVICKRFALIGVLFSKEKPFVILDDPFSNLDNEKLGNCISLIKKLSSEYQIIYFTCHDSRSA